MDLLRREGHRERTRSNAVSVESSLSPTSVQMGESSPPMEERPDTRRSRRFSLSRPVLSTLLRSRTGTTNSPYQNEPEMSEQPELDSPKTPTNRYTLTLSSFSTSRLDLPHLRSPMSPGSLHSPIGDTRPRSPMVTSPVQASAPTITTQNTVSISCANSQFRAASQSSPISRLSAIDDLSAASAAPEISLPDPVIHAPRRQTIRFQDIEDARNGISQRPHQTEEGTSNHNAGGESPDSSQGNQTEGKRRYLFCLPRIKSRRVRNQLFVCLASGFFLFLMLGIYLGLALAHRIANNQFTILIILVILFSTIIFCHAVIRLCLYTVRPPRDEEIVERGQLNHYLIPAGGYAIPREPIRVVLARDEEAAGLDSETVNMKPPAYGLWRESVRIDPNRIYWQRNEEYRQEDTSSAPSGSRSESLRNSSPRPPSYMSDDGVEYVVEARPRSVAPNSDVPLVPHPSERNPALPTML